MNSLNNLNNTTLNDLFSIGFDGVRGIFHEITNGITITDDKSKILYVNPAFSEITGYSYEEAVGDNPGILHSGRHNKQFYKQMWNDIESLGRWQGEIWNRRKSGEIYPEILTVSKLINSNKDVFYIAIFSDISNLVLENDKRLNMAFRDPLTNLFNRNYLEEKFNDYVYEYQRKEFANKSFCEQIVMLFIDINKFKLINDTYGHLIGDEILIFIATSLRNSTRKMDTLSRFGGDEFVVILPGIKYKKDILNFCKRLKTQLNFGTTVSGVSIVPSLSIGISSYPSDGKDYNTLLQSADKAMYFSKINKVYSSFASDITDLL